MEWILTTIGNTQGEAAIDGQSFDLPRNTVHCLSCSPPASLTLRSDGGKLGDSEDSFLFFGTRIDPHTENFTLRATVDLLEASGEKSGWQSGFGLAALDTAVSGRISSRYRNQVMVGRFRSDNPRRVDAGMRIVAGYHVPDAVEFGPGRMLDTSRHSTDPVFPDALTEGEHYLLTIAKTDSGFEGSIRVSDTEERFSLNGSDLLTVQDPDGIMAGFAVSGSIAVRFSDLSLSITKGVLSPVPADEIRPGTPDYPLLRDAVSFEKTPVTALRDKEIIYAAPDASSGGDGSGTSPVDLQSALDNAAPGTCILLKEGIYSPAISYRADAVCTEGDEILIAPAGDGDVILDGSHLERELPLFILRGNGYRLSGLIFRNSPSVGLFICGSGNNAERCTTYGNGDTGFLICSYPGTEREHWPADNTVLNCDSYANCDTAHANADGFGAKLSIGNGNRFIGCIAHHNIDDGFDLYSKSALGPIGPVRIERCIAYCNGYLPDGTVSPGKSGTGFKLGGENQSVFHHVKDCIAYSNRFAGFSSNYNPTLRLERCTSWHNGSVYAVSEYSLFTSRTDLRPLWDCIGLLPPHTGNIEIIGNDSCSPWLPKKWSLMDEDLLNRMEEDRFSSLFRSTDLSVEPSRYPDGSIDMHGLLEPVDPDLSSGGARIGTAHADQTAPAVGFQKNIMFLLPRLSGGGAEKVLAALSSRLAEEHNVYLVTTVKETRAEQYPISDRIRKIELFDLPEKHQPELLITIPKWLNRTFPFRAFRAVRKSVKHQLKRNREHFQAYVKESDPDLYYREKLYHRNRPAIARLKKLKKELRIDCSISFLNGVNFLNALSKGKDRTIISIRSCLRGPFAPSDALDPMGKLLIGDACRKADWIVSVSKETGACLSEDFGADPSRGSAIYNWVDPDGIRVKSQEPFQDPELLSVLENAETVFISVGRLVLKKGHWHLVRAFRAVVDRHPGAVLLILGRPGSGTEDTSGLLQTIIRESGLEKNVFLVGFCVNPYQYLARSDVFILPSFNEGFPNSLVEAMAMGLPVIASDCMSGPREILAPDTPFGIKAVKPDDAPYGILLPECSGEQKTTEPLEPQEQYLADAMCRLAEDLPLRLRYGALALIRARDFGIEQILAQWRELIESDRLPGT